MPLAVAKLALLLSMTLAHAEPVGTVDLNTADASTLSRLPGIGPERAAAIIAWRVANQRFDRIDQLLEVPGIGPATVANARQQLVVRDNTLTAANDTSGATGLLARAPVNINTANAAELAGLPGISRVRAADLVTDRERNGPFESCVDLTRVQGIGPATIAVLGPLCIVAPR